MIFVGRFLAFYFLGIQITAIRCYFDKDICKEVEIETTRLATNIVGLFLTLVISMMQFKYCNANLPIEDQPWSGVRTSPFHLSSRLLILTSVLTLALEDMIIEFLSYYWVFVPILALSTINLWMVAVS